MGSSSYKKNIEFKWNNSKQKILLDRRQQLEMVHLQPDIENELVHRQEFHYHVEHQEIEVFDLQQ
jgi:hypothetical protein